jgi:hypothetical protein
MCSISKPILLFPCIIYIQPLVMDVSWYTIMTMKIISVLGGTIVSGAILVQYELCVIGKYMG